MLCYMKNKFTPWLILTLSRGYKHVSDLYSQHMSHHMGKPTICICENKGADQLRGNLEADQRLCFR